MRPQRTFSSITAAIFLVIASFAFSANAFAGKYRVQIIRLSTDSVSGDVVLQIKPGKNETAFTGKSRAMLLGSDPGTDRTMATILTAITINAELIISVTNPPTFDDIQTISEATLIVP